jgi:hypothetical protein
MNKVYHLLLFSLGTSLWIPGIAILNINNSWGLQICICISLLLFILMLLSGLNRNSSKEKINIKKEMIFTHFTLFTGFLICTIFSFVGIQRSILTFAVEIFGLFFSFNLSWWICKNAENAFVFFKGFWIGGIVSSLYAIYQFLGLKVGLPFAYVEMNNMSFSLLDIDSASFHGRALGITPEPSILASLITMTIGISVANLLALGEFKSYTYFLITFLSLLATASQIIVIVPLYILTLLFAITRFSPQHRSLNKMDHLGVFLVIIMGLVAFVINPEIGNVFSRVSEIDMSSAKTQSATSRFYDVIVASQMFLDSPLVGNGLGSVTDLSQLVRTNLNLEGDSGSASTLFRVIAEQGIVGLTVIFINFKVIFSNNQKYIFTEKYNSIVMYSLICAFSITISMIFFVGYRSVYHTWLIMPMLLCFKSYATKR